MTSDHKQKLTAYLVSCGLFAEDERLIVRNLYEELDDIDGYVNLIFQVQSADKSVIIKQVLPYLRIWKESGVHHPVNMERMGAEVRMLIYMNTIYPDIAPEIYHVDEAQGMIVMEDLSAFDMLRSRMTKGVTTPQIGAKVGSFLATLFFTTSRFHLGEADFQTLKTFFRNDEDKFLHHLIFDDSAASSTKSPLFPEMEEKRQRMINSAAIKNNLEALREKYLHANDSLIHHDVHTSNIMVKDDRVKIFDTEFSGFGHAPIDMGRLMGSYFLNYMTWVTRAHRDGALAEKMKADNRRQVQDMALAFKKTLTALMQKLDGCPDPDCMVDPFMDEFFPDALCYAAIGQLIRVSLDAAMSQEVKALTEDEHRQLQGISLDFTRVILEEPARFKDLTKVDALFDIIDRL